MKNIKIESYTDLPSLHVKAMELAKNYRRCEVQLLEILESIDAEKIYLQMGYSSLFVYTTECLELSEANAYALIQVMRKSREVPELKQEISVGNLTISKARRIVPVLSSENKREWVEKAKSLPKAQLEREVAQVSGEIPKAEFLKPISQDRSRLRVDLSEGTASDLRRAQVIASSSKRKNLTLEEVLADALQFYLQHKDPVRKKMGPSSRLNKEGREFQINKRESVTLPSAPTRRKGPKLVSRRIPEPMKRAVWSRDEAQCQFHSKTGKVCGEVRHLEIHHARAWAMGGGHEAYNLTLRCRAHHQQWHHKDWTQFLKQKGRKRL